MTRAILRGYDLTEPRPDARGPAAGQRLPRLREPGAGRRLRHSEPAPQESWLRVLDALDALLQRWSTPTTTVREDPMTDLLTTPITADLVRGASRPSRPRTACCRTGCPAWARAQNTDPQLAMAEAQPSGVRLAFRTRATTIELDTLPTKRVYVGAPPRPDGVYDLVVDGRLAGQGVRGRRQHHDHRHGDRARSTTQSGPAGSVRFARPGRRHEGRRDLAAARRDDRAGRALRTDAPVEPADSERPQGVAAPRQLDQPRLERRDARPAPGPPSRPHAPASSCSTSASAAAPCSTRSSPARCATPPPT